MFAKSISWEMHFPKGRVLSEALMIAGRVSQVCICRSDMLGRGHRKYVGVLKGPFGCNRKYPQGVFTLTRHFHLQKF